MTRVGVVLALLLTLLYVGRGLWVDYRKGK